MIWPGTVKPQIPSAATERIVRVDAQGAKEVSEFWLKNRRVGRVHWFPNGRPQLAAGLERNRVHGYQVEYHEQGGVSFAEPFANGMRHGLAQQFDGRGRLLLVSPFVRGTGTDFWCDERGRLAEEHPLVRGRMSGIERWWNADGKNVFSETGYRAGLRHGVAREWLGAELRPGFPKFFLRGERVPKRPFTAAEPALYRPEDDQPKRELPERFLRERAARLAVR